MGLKHSYAVYGLVLQSDFPLSLPRAFSTPKNSIRIYQQTVSKKGLENAFYTRLYVQKNEHCNWFNIPDVGRFLVQNAAEILVEPSPEASLSSISYFIEKLCIDALLEQKKISKLPGFTLFFKDKTAVITGVPQLPFQKLALLFLKRGFSFLNPHFSAFNIHGQAVAGMPHFEIDQTTVENLSIPEESLNSIRLGNEIKRLPLHHQYHGMEAYPDYIWCLHKTVFAELRIKTHFEADKTGLIELQLPSTGLKLSTPVDIIQQHFMSGTFNHATA